MTTPGFTEQFTINPTPVVVNKFINNTINLQGINIHPDNPFMFDFIIEEDGDHSVDQAILQTESQKLINYFFAALTIPTDEMWVNLSPYEEDRIIPDQFAQTEMGKDLLEQDYQLKQLVSSLLNPNKFTGKDFWHQFYQESSTTFGTTDLPLNSFNKIWIVPDESTVYEHERGAYLIDNSLKVMLEQDYLALAANTDSTKHGIGDIQKQELKQLNELQVKILRETILPSIQNEIDSGDTFINLRQIYQAVILASWYKKALKESLFGKLYVDQKKIAALTHDNLNSTEAIYNHYLEAFETGSFDHTQQNFNPNTQQIIEKKYFTGGVPLNEVEVTIDQTMVGEDKNQNLHVVTVNAADQKDNYATYWKPLMISMLLTFITFPLGDIIAQALSSFMNAETWTESFSAITSTDNYNAYRILYMGILGTLSGAFFHHLFPNLNQRFTSKWKALPKIFVFEGLIVPVYFTLLLGGIELFKGNLTGNIDSFSMSSLIVLLQNYQILLEQNYLLLLIVGMPFWVIVSYLNFNTFAKKDFIKVMSTAYVIWGAYVSFIGHRFEKVLRDNLGEFLNLPINSILIYTLINLLAIYYLFYHSTIWSPTEQEIAEMSQNSQASKHSEETAKDDGLINEQEIDSFGGIDLNPVIQESKIIKTQSGVIIPQAPQPIEFYQQKNDYTPRIINFRLNLPLQQIINIQ